MSLVFFSDRNLGKRSGQTPRGLGLDVKLHGEHFPPDYPDEAPSQDVAKRAWILLTLDHRMHRNPGGKGALPQIQSRAIPLPPPKQKGWADHLVRDFHQAQGPVEAFFQRHSPRGIP